MYKTMADGARFYDFNEPPPTETPEGFIPTGNTHIFFPILERCQHRTLPYGSDPCCGGVDPLMRCNLLKKMVTRITCHQCPHFVASKTES